MDGNREELLEAIAKRTARRSYIKEPLDGAETARIEEFVREANDESGLDVEFYEDGGFAFRSLKTSHGMFDNVRSLLLMKGDATLPDLHEKVGYYGEELVLRFTSMGLGTCFVGATFDKEKFTVPAGEEFVCAILVGHVKPLTVKERIARAVTHRHAKTVHDMLRVDAGVSVPQWVLDGMGQVVLAPSAYGKQKPWFAYASGAVTAGVDYEHRLDLVDLGIAKRHFEIGADCGEFTFGNPAEFRRSH